MSGVLTFHLRGMLRHAKGAAKHVLGLNRPITQEQLMQTSAAWHTPIPNHPSELCKCECGPDGMVADHSEACEWIHVMCKPCRGSGHCQHCQGDGTDSRHTPEIPHEEWEHA